MANEAARPGPYVDTSITRRNVDNGVVPEAGPARSGSRTQGNIRRFYAEDEVEEVDSHDTHPEVDPPAHNPNKWVFGRDPYANNGMVGQEYFNNQG
jgi:hypothetical protein